MAGFTHFLEQAVAQYYDDSDATTRALAAGELADAEEAMRTTATLKILAWNDDFGRTVMVTYRPEGGGTWLVTAGNTRSGGDSLYQAVDRFPSPYKRCDHTGIGRPGCLICDPRTISEGGPQDEENWNG